MSLSIYATDSTYQAAHLPAWAQGYRFTEPTPGTPQAYVGQCRVCKRGIRVMVTVHRLLRYENNLGMQGQSLKLKVVHRTYDHSGALLCLLSPYGTLYSIRYDILGYFP